MTELSEVVIFTKNSSLLASKMLSSINTMLKQVCDIDVDKVSVICVSTKSTPAAQKWYKSYTIASSISLPTALLDM